jgi:osmoprotectant transport system substrate-binding protein
MWSGWHLIEGTQTQKAPTARRWSMVACVALLLALATACQGPRRAPRSASGTSIVIGSASTPEQRLLGELTALILQGDGHIVDQRMDLGDSRTLRRAFVARSIDICWEYTGDTWTSGLGHDYPIADPDLMYQKIRDEDALNQITWLPPAPAQRTLVLLMTRSQTRAWGIGSLSDLARHVSNLDSRLALCTPHEIYSEPSGVRGLERVYGFQFDPTRIVYGTIQEGYAALNAGRCDAALGYVSDSALLSADLQVIRDDLGFFLASNLAVGIRTPVLQQMPDVERPLRQLSERLTQEALADLTAQITQGARPEVVARRFLRRTRWQP